MMCEECGFPNVSYEEIKKANESINTTEIKGKNYAEVNQRIKAFRMVYPMGTIQTRIISNENGVCIMSATVGVDMGDTFLVLGEGTAYEKEGSTFINKTSYIENCETSAVGRALGMAGFGIDVSVASAEEVQNAIINQTANEKITAIYVDTLAKRCEKDGVNIEELCKLYKVKSLNDLTYRMLTNINEHWEKIKMNGGAK